MRHFNATIPTSKTIYVGTNTSVESLRQIRLDYLEPHLDGDTPASDRVRSDFRDWYFGIEDRDSVANPCVNASFVYSNFNTGAIVVFIAWYGYEEHAGTYLSY